ncbi:MAG: carbon storage regulator CsrA [Gudongella sp.]|jgi:carbon storage regulator|nr:carbon storage regulator CsrA [Gudongella sp.]
MMLVLNRKVGESIMLGDDIEIKILEIADGKLKIGIEAPRKMSILRKEIYDQVAEENRKAAQTDKDIISLFLK